MISMLSMPKGDPNYKLDLKKASEKLGKALNEVQIRSLVQSLLQKNDTDMYVGIFSPFCLKAHVCKCP